MQHLTCTQVVEMLSTAPEDSRTGNKTLYAVSWLADKDSMIGKRNEDWVQRELAWFATGSNSLDVMKPPVPQAFQNCAGKDNLVNSAYGHILYGSGDELPEGTTLFERIVYTLLIEGMGTRHAVAIISDRDIHTLAYKDGRKDFICTNALNIMVDDDNRLHIIAQMRSMDAVWGYRADYSMWDYLMDDLLDNLHIAGKCEVTRGDIFFQVANLHVYPRHFDLLKKQADQDYDNSERIARRQWMSVEQRQALARKEL